MNVSFLKYNVSSHLNMTRVFWLCSMIVNKQLAGNKSIQVIEGVELHLPKCKGIVARHHYKKGEVILKN